MIKPNFFIVGAPKCGTTALYTYLRAHPDIFMPFQKEPHHFALDLPAPRYDRFRDRDAYVALFENAGSARRVGEASVCYLYSRLAAREIKKFNPRARIIIMLRSPVEAMHSFYYQQIVAGEEDLTDFAAALSVEEERKQGRSLPPHLMGPVDCLFYRDIVRYADQVRRYLAEFGRTAVHIIIYDDFKADAAAAYRATLKFLEVDPDFHTDFRIVNRSKQIRSTAMRDFLVKPPTWYKRVLRLGRMLVPETMRYNISQSIRRLNTQPLVRPPLTPELRARLQNELLPDVEALSELLERDLTHWCED